jgi:outer membrane receptor for ferrienterochelin and colicins
LPKSCIFARLLEGRFLPQLDSAMASEFIFILMKQLFLIFLIALLGFPSWAQRGTLSGQITTSAGPVPLAHGFVKEVGRSFVADEQGYFKLTELPPNTYTLWITAVGYQRHESRFFLQENENKTLEIKLISSNETLDEVVVSGTLKPVSKLESAVPVEVYTQAFFKANPTPSVFEAMQQVNGVRPQLNCNICNTGDIRINGLPGPYTMVLIDGMPLVSGLSTVYGLTGIPQALIERVEVVKGPASTLYGSEAMGGLINIITKNPLRTPQFSADIFTTSWQESNYDLGLKIKANDRLQSMWGLNFFHYQNPIDHNADGLTDVALQSRVSVFNKWRWERPHQRILSLAGRWIYEDRWGGQTNWTPAFWGGDQVYGESIFTKRWELLGVYQLPTTEKITIQLSANGHNQNSVYGTTPYLADQRIAFGQLLWDKKIGAHDWILGLAYRYTFYDDNTPATATVDGQNQPSVLHLPGIFVQDELSLSTQSKLLLGLRYDRNSLHGHVFSPRVNFKWASVDKQNVLRASLGNGFRVANIFTEDHAALSGARQVVFAEKLRPETSWNGNVNLIKKYFSPNNTLWTWDFSAFYSYFNNRILPDYESDPNKIIYSNLDGYSVAQGLSLSLDVDMPNGLELNAGLTWMDVSLTEQGRSTRQLLTERLSGVWRLSYAWAKGLKIDYTGNFFGPMDLPLLGPLDDRPAQSPFWSLQNIQLTQPLGRHWELYGGVKNLLNYTPPANSIARAFDPFDRGVTFDSAGQVVATPSNPQALTFDPTYMYAPNQGRRAFLGLRYAM